MEVAVAGMRSMVSSLNDNFTCASAGLVFFPSTWYGANSAKFSSDVNFCKWLRSTAHTCNR